MSELQDDQVDRLSHRPSDALQKLDRLVGTWDLSGDVRGQVRYEWMEGGFFLVQHIDLDHQGHRIKGMEVIGHLKPFGGASSPDIRTRWYDNEGNTFDYVYELEEDTLLIWGGEKGSPAYYKGKFSPNGNQLTGGWVYPGGGYESNATRLTPPVGS
jgi:hypothetical protein